MKRRPAAHRAELRRWKEEVARNPDSPLAHLKLGTALLSVGFLGESQVALERALELDPNRVEAWVNLGGVRLGRWDFAGCIEANQEALNRKPELMRAHFNQGLAYMYLGEAEKMFSCFERVLELEPDSGAGHYYLAVALHALGKTKQARAFLTKALDLGYSPDPSFIKALEGPSEDVPEQVQIFEFGPRSNREKSKH